MDRKIILLITANVVLAAILGVIIGMYLKSGQEDCLRDDDPYGQLRVKVASLADSLDAIAGVAVIFDNGDTLSYNGDVRFPMLSVFKFHQSLAVCDSLRRAGMPLSGKVLLTGDDLPENTWSPLRDEYPDGGIFSYSDLLVRTLQQSDNNVCDFLFRTICSPAGTEEYIRSLGIDDFAVVCDEKTMHDDLSACYANWSTPRSAARLLETFYAIRDSDDYTRFIWQTMSGCSTGTGRIPGYISDQVSRIARKTGTGDRDASGRIMAVNDMGVVVLPDGRHFCVAVFVTGAGCGMEECEEFIAAVSQAVLLQEFV